MTISRITLLLILLVTAGSTDARACVCVCDNDFTVERYIAEASVIVVGRVLEIKRAAFGDRHAEVAFTLANLGATFAERGDHERPSGHYLRALEIQEAILGPDVELRRTGYDLTRAAEVIRGTPYPQAEADASDVRPPLLIQHRLASPRRHRPGRLGRSAAAKSGASDL